MLQAHATFYPYFRPYIYGTILFSQYQKGVGVRVDINLYNVPTGIHGIHVHQGRIFRLEDLKNKDCCDALKGHFTGGDSLWSLDNPQGIPHGSCSLGTLRHTGDLCNNISSDLNGIVKFTYVDDLISLKENNPNCIVGRSVVIHADPDDEGLGNNIDSKISGNSGKRIACANIDII